MKKVYTIVLLAMTTLCACDKESVIRLKEVDDVCTQMDDINFMRYCYDNFDVNHDGKVSMLEAQSVKSLSITYEDELKIISVKGIEYFTELESLIIDGDRGMWHSVPRLNTLDLSNNRKLTYLNCSCNFNLSSLNISKNTELTHLECQFNALTSIDVSNNVKLSFLKCYQNRLTSLDVSNNTLLEVFLYNPQEEGMIIPIGWTE